MGGGDTDWPKIYEHRKVMRRNAQVEMAWCERIAKRLSNGRDMSLTSEERDLVVRVLRQYKPAWSL